MALLGRRRASLFYLIAAAALLFLLSATIPAAAAASVGSGVIGIDLGTEYIKAVLVKPGIPLEIVLTKDSKRKEAAVVAFKPARESSPTFPERFYGGDASSLAARFPDDVYANLKTLLGLPMDTGIQGSGSENENLVEMYRQRYPALKIEAASGDRGTVGFRSTKVGTNDGKEPFLVEELLSMQLKQVKANAETLGGKGTNIKKAAITVPPFYTAEEKRSVELAAKLAGLDIVSMVSDGLAVGINYATSRTFPNISDGKKPEYHVVFDMGAGSTSANVLRLQSRTVKDVGKFNKTVQEIHVLGTAWDKTMGGDMFNQLIVDDMVEKFVATKKLGDVTVSQVRAHGKTMAKLWKDSERVRQVLSANTETTVSFENLYQEDVNFKYTLTRAEFEKITEKYAKQVTVPLTEAIATAGLEISDIESVILHGGATRTPFVKKALEESTDGKVRTNVNADEAAVFGAAFKAASLSPSFRVKEIRTYDTSGYSINMRWKSGNKDRQQNIFTPYSETGSVKYLTVKNVEDFTIKFSQVYPRNGKQIEAPILEAETANLTASSAKLRDEFGCSPVNITTMVSVRLNPVNGLPEVVGGSVSCDVQIEKKGVVEDVKEFFGLGSKKSDQEPIKGPEDAIDLEATSSSYTASTADTASASATPSPSSSKEAEKATKEPKVRIESISVGFTSTVLGIPPITSEEMKRIQDRLAAFDASDLSRVHREEAFNELEAFIYKGHHWLDEETFTKATTKDVLKKLEEKLSILGEWLHDDGTSAGIEELKDKLRDLKGIVDPVVDRRNEGLTRPKKVDALKGSLDSTKMLVEIMESQIKAEEELYSSSLSAYEAASTEAPSSSANEDSSTPTGTPSDGSDGNGDLDDDNFAESSSATQSAPPAKPTLSYSLYSPEDLSAAASLLKSTTKWLESKLEEQNKLSEFEDPALTIAEIDVKLKEIEKVLSTILTKQRRQGSSKSKPITKKNVKNMKSQSKSKAKPKTTGTMVSQNIKETPKSETKSAKDEL
ncbi:Hypoxia up-regulated protein 1 [Trichophyton interdigitale]|uniref:Hypoxia up-regulated protein 1 n=1 Tax=Trichophyton interdigitale TaxID=101480 RepID=A0A9P4YKY9_9EURO|nr:Hypoxia up-regulated protein 1 [Trichophyton interdigitale]KAF3898532.1 Hypoxia up-regulated protein 1 [Trichophyton interdigitale]KAG8212251.1 Hypoxia up-regulated protein 1 [Trichophyton interdigitale]